MCVNNINTKEYWDNRFNTNWTVMQGKEQTKFFIKLAIDLLPEWIIRELRINKYSICDIGCAEGEGVDLLSKYLGYHLDGSDFSEVAIQKARSKYPDCKFHIVDLNHIPEDFTYDVIFSSNVLEHFETPWEIIENISKKVNKYIILLFPFQETMIVDEHVYKFDTDNIPLNINDFSLIYASSVDGRTIENTYYADNQILLIYTNQIQDKNITNLDAVFNGVETYNGNIIKELKNKINDYQNKIIDDKVKIEEYLNLNYKLLNANKDLEIEKRLLLELKENLEDSIQKTEAIKESLITEKTELKLKIVDLKNYSDSLELKINEEQERYKLLEEDYQRYKDIIYSSFSWRITKIFRAMSKLTRMHKVRTKYNNYKSSGNSLRSIMLFKIKRSKGYPIIKKIIPKKVLNKLYRKYNSDLVIYQKKNSDPLEFAVQNFVQSIVGNQQVIMIFSGVKYIDNEGQRNIRLVHEALKKGIKIIFVYWRWNTEEEIEESNDDMLQVPIDYLYANRVIFFENYLKENNKKAFLVEFPHPYVPELIEIANCYNWITIYDVIDDWEEFSKCGQAVWYEKAVETRIANMVDINIATASRLREKITERMYNTDHYYVISNGVDPNRIKREKRDSKYDFRKGELQIGYFGHLTDAWFDWDLVKNLANRHKEWTFHIIGYGQPECLKLPENIILYGKKEPGELPKYAAFWDVAIIPFINCELTLSVNPIKIYEYMQLKLPTVASNMPEVKKFPYTRIAIGVQQFEKAIEKSYKTEMDIAIIQEFIMKNTWEVKLNEFLRYIEGFRLEGSYKQIYKDKTYSED